MYLVWVCPTGSEVLRVVRTACSRLSNRQNAGMLAAVASQEMLGNFVIRMSSWDPLLWEQGETKGTFEGYSAVADIHCN